MKLRRSCRLVGHDLFGFCSIICVRWFFISAPVRLSKNVSLVVAKTLAMRPMGCYRMNFALMQIVKYPSIQFD